MIQSINRPADADLKVLRTYCYNCGKENDCYVVTDKKIVNQFKNQRADSRQKRVASCCRNLGFSCSFGEQHAMIKTSVSAWRFNYLDDEVTLLHESTRKTDQQTGEYRPYHIQFSNRQMTPEQVVSFIARHDKFRQTVNERNASDNIMIAFNCIDCGFNHTFTERGEVLDSAANKRIPVAVYNGEYGRGAKKFYTEHKNVSYTVRSMVYRCSKCGDLQGMQYFRMDADGKHYTWRQVCESCNAYSMRIVPYRRLQSTPCPKCGSLSTYCETITPFGARKERQTKNNRSAGAS